jgi:hypothetical protein
MLQLFMFSAMLPGIGQRVRCSPFGYLPDFVIQVGTQGDEWRAEFTGFYLSSINNFKSGIWEKSVSNVKSGKSR